MVEALRCSQRLRLLVGDAMEPLAQKGQWKHDPLSDQNGVCLVRYQSVPAVRWQAQHHCPIWGGYFLAGGCHCQWCLLVAMLGVGIRSCPGMGLAVVCIQRTA